MPEKAGLKGIFHEVFRLKDNPESIAKGFALGTIIGMTPFVGFQFIFSVTLATIFRINKIAAGLGVFNTNIVTGLLIFSFNFWLGGKILGLNSSFSVPDKLDFTFLESVLKSGYDVFTAMLVGGLVTGIPLSIVAYCIVLVIFKKKIKFIHDGK